MATEQQPKTSRTDKLKAALKRATLMPIRALTEAEKRKWEDRAARKGLTLTAAIPEDVTEKTKKPQAVPHPQPEDEGLGSILSLAAALARIFEIEENDTEFLRILPYMADFKLYGADEKQAIVKAHEIDVLVSKAEVYVDKQGLTAAEAYDLALLAVANPAMREHGVKLDGHNDADMQLLIRAAESVGLKIINAPEKMDPAMKEQADKAWDEHAGIPPLTDELRDTLNTMLEMNGAPEDARTPEKLLELWRGLPPMQRMQVQHMAEQMKNNPEGETTNPATDADADSNADAHKTAPVTKEPAPLPESVSQILKTANIDEDTYRQARALVVEKQAVTQSMLREAFKIGASKAVAIQCALAADGIMKHEEKTVVVTKERTKKQNSIVVKPGERDDVALAQTMNEAASTPVATAEDTAQPAQELTITPPGAAKDENVEAKPVEAPARSAIPGINPETGDQTEEPEQDRTPQFRHRDRSRGLER